MQYNTSTYCSRAANTFCRAINIADICLKRAGVIEEDRVGAVCGGFVSFVCEGR